MKLKDVGLSMLPIMLVVLILHFGFAHFEVSLLVKFFVSILIITIGEILFLTGVDGSIMKMGDLVGNSVKKFSHFAVVLFFAFIFGFFATIAEPDLNVLSSQATSVGIINISKFVLVFVVGAGVGIFVAFALFRIVKNINYKIVILVIMICTFTLAYFVPDSLIALSFDAGGATTGIITSPFLLALTSGVAKNKNKQTSSDNFGVIGIASLGPVIAMLLLSVIYMGKPGASEVVASGQINIFLEALLNTILAVLPLVFVFLVFDLMFLKVNKRTRLSLFIGSFVTFVGLYLFLFGIDFGLLQMGNAVGVFLATKPSWLSIIVGIVIGFLITFTEPSVRVLGSQVEEITQGNIRRRLVTIAIAFAMMLAVTLAIVKIIFNISIWWIIGLGYLLIVILMPFSSNTFVSIAFDSGGVASGPMSAAFVLPLMTGFASLNGGAVEGFGLIAIVAMLPILVLEVLGIVYKIKTNALSSRQYKKALRISYGIDVYSNIDSLEEAYNRRKLLKEMEQEKNEAIIEQKLLEKQLEDIKKAKEGDGEHEIKG